ncbi:hypothetical protein ACW2QC_09260 [Virgibacillus sp. FSP13]
MVAKGQLRGHGIEFLNNEWVYSDTKEPTVINGQYQERSCGHCGKECTPEGHDGCLGTLPGVMNACCGHGQTRESYVQFLDGYSIHGEDGLSILNILKKHKYRSD